MRNRRLQQEAGREDPVLNRFILPALGLKGQLSGAFIMINWLGACSRNFVIVADSVESYHQAHS